MSASTAQLTPDALLLLPKPPEGKQYELSDRELIVVGNAGALDELIKTRVFEILTEYRLRMKNGRAFAETQFTLRQDRARIPDVAWVGQDKLALIPRANQAIPIAPDLAVEIISDSEAPEETEQRLRDYLGSRQRGLAGVPVACQCNGVAGKPRFKSRQRAGRHLRTAARVCHPRF